MLARHGRASTDQTHRYGVTAMFVRPSTALLTVLDAWTTFGLPAHFDVDVTLIA